MPRFIGVLLVCALTSTLAFAAGSQPSEESLRRLLAVTEAKSILEQAFPMMDQTIEASTRQALKGRTLDAQSQKVIDEMRAKLSALLRETLAWEAMEPMFLDIYRSSLSQSEVDGMLKFYESEAGKAVIRKMPLIMQNTMQAMQGRMQTLAPKVVEIQKDALAKLKAAESK